MTADGPEHTALCPLERPAQLEDTGVTRPPQPPRPDRDVIPHLPPEPPSLAHEDKLYLVTRADLSAGYQITQTVHAAADFAFAHPAAAARWHDVSNSLIVLAVPDQDGLHALLVKARAKGVTFTVFREPDLADELTAVAFTPSPATRRLLSNVPLAGTRLAEQGPLLERERALRAVSAAMRDCEQTKGQDVLAHGRSVREHYFALTDHLAGRGDLGGRDNWRLPSWLAEYRDQLAGALLPAVVMDRYLTLHDCGKPSVRTVDAEGRVHFPGHADASRDAYLALPGADPLVGQLIADDMTVHQLSAADVPAFASSPTAVSQLLAGVAEVTSNAAMFGGIGSTSFKVKFKHLERRGRAICKELFGDPQAG